MAAHPSRPAFNARPFVVLAALGGGLLAFGSLGYMIVEDWAPLDALYMTVITVTTVGFGEVRELSNAGEIFTIFLILAGATAMAVALGVFGNTFLANLPNWRLSRMEKSIEKYSNHVVLCGFGRIGRTISEELRKAERDFVVIDRSVEGLSELDEFAVPYIVGNATDEGILRRAGVERASGVISAVHSDADNLFITMTARQLNESCAIVARAEDPNTEPKLKLVGAHSVVTPYTLGGRRLAQAFLHPGAVGLADLAMGAGPDAIGIEEVRLPANLPDACSTLMGLRLNQEFGLIAVAVRGHNEAQPTFNPRADTHLSQGDYLLVLGEHKGIDRFLDFLASDAPQAPGIRAD